jgi:hypothetical protein
MAKIIPIIVAIVLLVGGGAFMVWKISSTVPSVYPNQQMNATVAPSVQTGQTVSNQINTALPPAAPTIDKSKNQITLKITSPSDGATVTSPAVTIKGVTIPNAEVSVNDKDVTAGATGSFAVSLTLDEGDNYISVVATDADGNAAETDLTVTLNTGN